MILTLVGAICAGCANDELLPLSAAWVKPRLPSSRRERLLVPGQWAMVHHQGVKVVSLMHHCTESYLSQYINLEINDCKSGNTSFVVPRGLCGSLASLIWDGQKRIPLHYLNVPRQL